MTKFLFQIDNKRDVGSVTDFIDERLRNRATTFFETHP